ncbi:Os09g0316300 [Oryza sativa Japonica Group]|uniref:Os09g0316300 protein n=1 Tax=Oryza sativa subsp. japonica TaxID=39947 RepID=A0A0P0XJY3_ORYSJ|nr:hypothetical protein DAI22_04g284927 [Oryza sativa Japonica Group]BAT07421.1 Os09g0316300 [Oryza sativa Japonica Group]
MAGATPALPPSCEAPMRAATPPVRPAPTRRSRPAVAPGGAATFACHTGAGAAAPSPRLRVSGSSPLASWPHPLCPAFSRHPLARPPGLPADQLLASRLPRSRCPARQR